VRQATFGDMAEVVEVDPSGILWVLSAFDGRRYWTGPENLVTQGYGERFLKVKTEAAEPLNRRVTIKRITPLISYTAER